MTRSLAGIDIQGPVQAEVFTEATREAVLGMVTPAVEDRPT